MVYDPQRGRPRQRPNGHEPSIVDSLLDTVADQSGPTSGDMRPPPATSTVTPEPTPEPASAWSERLLYSVGFSTVLGAAVGLLTLRWLWKLWKRRTR